MWETWTVCKEHNNKIIFVTQEEADNYIRLKFPDKDMKTYLCPVAKSHFHFRDEDRRRKKRNRRRQRI